MLRTAAKSSRGDKSSGRDLIDVFVAGDHRDMSTSYPNGHAGYRLYGDNVGHFGLHRIVRKRELSPTFPPLLIAISLATGEFPAK